eukprot:855921_1
MATNIKVQYYADDTVLTSQYDANNTHNKAAHDFQLAISYVEWYCRLHHLQINPTKTVYMIFSNKVDRNKYALPLVICDAKLDPTKHDQTRYLGVILRYDLRWNAHIQHTLSRCWNVYHSITKSIKFMWRTNTANIQMILEACILNKLLYAAPLLSEGCQKLMNCMMRIATNTTSYPQLESEHPHISTNGSDFRGIMF